MRKGIILSLVFAAAMIWPGSDFWMHNHLKWFLLLGVLFFWIGLDLGERFHWSVAPAFWSTSLGSLVAASIIPNQFSDLEVTARIFVSHASSTALYSFLAISLFCILALDRVGVLQAIEGGFGWVCVTDSLLVCLQKVLGAHTNGGFYGNSSMNGCLIAMTLPFLVRLRMGDRWMAGAVLSALVAVFLSGASQPVGVLCVVMVAAASSFFRGDGAKRGFLIASFACAAVVFLAGACFVPDFLGSNGRFQVWEAVVRWVLEHHPSAGASLFGVGGGSGSALIPGIQQEYGISPDISFPWLHSDWFEVDVFLGRVGFGAVALMFGYSLRAAWDRPYLFAVLAGFGACAVFNYPTHAPMHALVGMITLLAAFRDRKPRRLAA